MSLLSSLLIDDRHVRSWGKCSTPTYEIEWWNEKPRRPCGYVKHFQPMSTSYLKKPDPRRDYGDVVTASIVASDEDGGMNFQEDFEKSDGET
jgi:hypothetical protein